MTSPATTQTTEATETTETTGRGAGATGSAGATESTRGAESAQTAGSDGERPEWSFLLLKPDCLRFGHRSRVDREIELAGLTVGCRHELTLTPPDVRYLWSEYSDDHHVLALGFLDRYLCTGPAEVLLVTGPDAFEGARRLKRSIRRQYARGVFSNVVHAAETRDELVRQGTLLLSRCPVCSVPLPTEGITGNPLRPPGLSFGDMFDVEALVEELWTQLEDGLQPPPPAPLGDRRGVGTAAVFLGVDSANSLDSAVTAVWRSVPGISVRRALTMTLYAGRSGGHPIAVGTDAEVTRCHERLREMGIVNTWCGPLPG